jgi:chaperonin GroEL
VDELKEQKKSPESEYELKDLDVRIGKLTSGIARLNIYGLSAAETREKRDRAEDAWMAIRGTIKYGALPGGGYVLTRVAADLIKMSEKTTSEAKAFACRILGEAIKEPVRVLYRNYGYNESEINSQLYKIMMTDDQVYDLAEQKWLPKHEVLDSLPAVVEAIKNSISIASLLGTLGGIVAFKRDAESDKEEERFVRQWEAASGERGSVTSDA